MNDFYIFTKIHFINLKLYKDEKVILALIVIIGFYSCNKNDDPANPVETTSGYLPLTVGNYWIYQQYFDKTEGTFVPASILDSTCISKDTIINGKTFYRFETYEISKNTDNPVKFKYAGLYRDSARHLINSNREVVFSENNFTDVLYQRSDIVGGDTATWLTFKMEALNQNVTFPAGSFTEVLDVKGTVICNPKFTSIPNPRYVDNYYAKNVGKIMYSSIYVAGGGTLQWRLLRYNVKR